MWVRSTEAQTIRDRRTQTPRGREKGREKCPRTQRHPRLSMENLKSSSFLLTSTEESVEGEPETLGIQVCTRCIIGAGFCSLQQFVSNEIIFADSHVLSRYHTETVSGLQMHPHTRGRPLIRLCASNQSQNTTHEGKRINVWDQWAFFFF